MGHCLGLHMLRCLVQWHVAFIELSFFTLTTRKILSIFPSTALRFEVSLPRRKFLYLWLGVGSSSAITFQNHQTKGIIYNRVTSKICICRTLRGISGRCDHISNPRDVFIVIYWILNQRAQLISKSYGILIQYRFVSKTDKSWVKQHAHGMLP